MFGSDRGIIFASIAGLILIGAVQPSQPPHDAEQRQAASADQNAASSVVVPNPPSATNDPGCDRGDDNRQSDLCAQWKAADAARDAADASWWQAAYSLAGLLIGIGTLIFAGLAAKWARKAAIEAGKGATATVNAVEEAAEANRIARDGHNANLRAWLKADLRDLSLTIAEEVHISASFDILNIGQTPALRVWFATKVGIHGVSHKLPDYSDHLQSEQDKVIAIADFRGKALFPTEGETIKVIASLDNPPLLQHYKGDGGGVWFTLAVRFFYESQGHIRHTDRYYQIAGPRMFAINALRGLDPNKTLQETEFRLNSGGSIA